MIAKRMRTWLNTYVQAEHAPLWREAVWLASLTGAMFFLVYGTVNYYTATRMGVPSLYLPGETQLPFVPWMILPYMSIDVLFVLAFFLCRDRHTLRTLAARVSFAILVSCSLFLLVPMKFAFIKPDTNGIFGMLFNTLTLDLPYNQFPSLHVSLALILLPVFRNRASSIAKPLVSIWFALIVVSTVLVYQHHLIDIAGGMLVAALALHFFGTEVDQKQCIVTRQHRRMALRFFLVTILLLELTMLLGGWAYLLLYPALSTLLVAGAYITAHSDFLAKKRQGYAWWTWLLLAPYLLGSHLGWRYFARRDTPWVELIPGLMVGRRPSRVEVTQLQQAGVIAVLDLAPELIAPSNWNGVHYRHLPVLDYSVPSPAQIDIALAFISRHSQYGTVYVHCALGYLRSVSLLAAYLMKQGYSRTEAMRLLKRERPKAVFPSYVQGALARFGLAQAESVVN